NTVADPTKADPRLAATTVNAQGTVVPKYVDESGSIKMLPSFIFWCVFLFLFSYLGTILPIWRFAQPVNYIGFWVTFLTIGLSALGAITGGGVGGGGGVCWGRGQAAGSRVVRCDPAGVRHGARVWRVRRDRAGRGAAGLPLDARHPVGMAGGRVGGVQESAHRGHRLHGADPRAGD